MSDGRGRGGDPVWWAALNQVEGVGPATMLRLARTFGSAEAAVAASRTDLIARGRLTAEQAAGVRRQSDSIAELRARIAAWERAGIRLLSMGDPGYPWRLLDLKTPPPLLYLRGSILPEDDRSVAIVGSREATSEGEAIAFELARGLAERGFTNVSGLAHGIDTAGHRGSLAAPSGRTLAILGSGLLRVYPPDNAGLAAEIANRGCLLAEVPPESEVNRRFLLARDRLQAALARAVIVVQARRECGSIVTATHALGCRRLLLATPWEEGPFAEGWRKLKSMGAIPVDGETDLDALAERLLTAEPSAQQDALL